MAITIKICFADVTLFRGANVTWCDTPLVERVGSVWPPGTWRTHKVLGCWMNNLQRFVFGINSGTSFPLQWAWVIIDAAAADIMNDYEFTMMTMMMICRKEPTFPLLFYKQRKINCIVIFHDIVFAKFLWSKSQARRHGGGGDPPPLWFAFFFFFVSSAVSHGHNDKPLPPLWLFFGGGGEMCRSTPPPPPPPPAQRLLQGWRKLLGSRSRSETFCPPPPPPLSKHPGAAPAKSSGKLIKNRKFKKVKIRTSNMKP